MAIQFDSEEELKIFLRQIGVDQATNELRAYSKSLKEVNPEISDFIKNAKLLTKSLKIDSSGKEVRSLEKYRATIKGIQKEISIVSSKGKETATISETPIPKIRSIVGYNKVKEQAKLLSSETKVLTDGTRKLIETFQVTTRSGVTTYTAINKKVTDVKTTNKKVNTELQKTLKRFNKLGTIFNAIKRIGFYRLIRSTIKVSTDGLKNGITSLAKFDEGVNSTMSEYMNTFKQLQNSIGSTAYSILQPLLPVFKQISETILSFTDNINKSLAIVSGQDYFYRAKKGADDFNESLDKTNKSLLSFDKFESLTQGDETTTETFERVTISEEDRKNLSGVTGILDSVKGVMSDIWEIAKDIISIIGGIIELLWPIFQPILDFSNSIIEEIKGIFKMLSGFVKLLQGDFEGAWKSIANGFASMINGVVNMLISAINILLVPIMEPINSIIRIFGGKEIDYKIKWKMDWQPYSGYANGGIPAKSELFYMNEFGKPEALVNTGGSQTNVININQLSFGMKQGFVDAIYETGLLDAMQSKVIVEGRNIDNSTVARGLFNALKTESVRRGGNQL